MIRRLSAILAADVVDYSRLVGENQAKALKALRDMRREVFEPEVSRHDGNIIKHMGDGWIVEFNSVTDAVACAIDIQMRLSDHEIISLRAGIHIGEVFFEDQDIFGDGINIAARLEALSKPSEIMISDNAYQVLDESSATALICVGVKQLKNIKRPTKLWRWSESENFNGISKEIRQSFIDSKKPSIAVLSFENHTGDPSQEYFSDGISEDIITALSKIHWLLVIARNSTFTYKGSTAEPARVAQELGVRYVLEGSLRRSADKLRVTAQLVDGSTGNTVWAERYDRQLDDIFAVQDEITETIAGRIDSEIRASEMNLARRMHPTSLDAWEIYQKGMWHVYKRTVEDNKKARNLFQDAIEQDTGFALAYAGLAETYYVDLRHKFGGDRTDLLKKGISAGERATSLDDMEGITHYSLGRMLMIAGEGGRAISELERAVALNPSFAHGYLGLGAAMAWFGQGAKGISKLEMAMRLSPHDPLFWVMETYISLCHINIRDFQQAEFWARRSVNSRPENFGSHAFLVTALVARGQLEMAQEAMDRALKMKPDLSQSNLSELLRDLNPDDLALCLDAVKSAGLPA